jgi:hypothetical protein
MVQGLSCLYVLLWVSWGGGRASVSTSLGLYVSGPCGVPDVVYLSLYGISVCTSTTYVSVHLTASIYGVSIAAAENKY